MLRQSICMIIFITLSLVTISNAQTKIYTNAEIWTGDSSNPKAKAIVVEGNKIIYVGNNYSQYQTSSSSITNLHGKMVVPGFIDNHTHFLAGGYQLDAVNLREAKSKSAFINTLKKYCAERKSDRWVMGGDWDHEAWGGTLPTHQWIDSVTGNHPAFINRYDGHMALANAIALKKAHIDRNTVSPPGGEIVKDGHGEPTGILRDEAMNLMYNVIPEPTEKEFDEYLQRAAAHAISFGVTQVNDMSSYGGWNDLATYRRAYAAHALPLRVYSFVPIATWQRLAKFVSENGRGDEFLHWGGLKAFVDGSLGSTTAWFYRPYLDAPNSTGLQVTDTSLLRQWILSADSAKLHVATHAIGDHANDFILAVYQEAEIKNGSRDRRFRVEHAQHLSPSAVKAFASMHVIPSMQPYHAIDDGKWAFKRLDSDRLSRTYAFQRLLSNGAVLTFGTDWTVAPINPLLGIYAAVTRRTLDDKNPNGWFPQEKITVEQALRCYTVNSAYAGFQENKTGMLKTGMLADFVVLSDNLFTIPPQIINKVRVVMTVIDGKVVYAEKTPSAY